MISYRLQGRWIGYKKARQTDTLGSRAWMKEENEEVASGKPPEETTAVRYSWVHELKKDKN